MLSVEEDPSCSYQVTAALQSDDRSLDSPAREASCVPEEASPQFSIRDYVFSTRQKDIGTNWPFPQQYLQLCLKHGVSSLLPPFEPPDSVRSHRFLENKRSELLLASIGSGRCTAEQDSTGQEEPPCSTDAMPKHLEHDNHLTSDSLVLESAVEGGKRILAKGKSLVTCGAQFKEVDGLKDGEVGVESLVVSHPPIEQKHLNHFPQPHNAKVLKTSAALEFKTPSSLPGGGKVGSTRESSGKKYKLIVKLGANPELACADEVSSNSSMISDSMASKVCPVCKTFTSTSNTTLNAHIDQCLSMESNANHVMDAPVTYKVKPTKKRLMVDIYTSAPCCTLEDLDRRNGTSWASDLGMLEYRKDFCTDNKRQKVPPADQADGEMEKGAVYVDTNGNKICILSKLNATTPSSPVESSNPDQKRLGKCIKEQMRLKMRRRHLALKSGNMKAEAAKKQVGLLGSLKDHRIHQEASSSQYPFRSNAPRVLRQRFDSLKGSALLKKLNGPHGPSNCGKSSTVQGILLKSSCSHPVKPSTMKCLSPRIKSMNTLSDASSAGDCKEKPRSNIDDCHLIGAFSSEGSGILKPPKSPTRLTSFPRKKPKKDSQLPKRRGKFSVPKTNASQSFPDSLVEGGDHSDFHKTKQILPRSSSVEEQCEKKKHKLMFKRLRRHTSGERSSKDVDKFSDTDENLDTKNYGAKSVNGADDVQASRIARTDDTIHLHLSDQSVVHQCGHKVLCGLSDEDGVCHSPERLNSEGVNHSPEAAVDVEMQDEHSADSATLANSMVNCITNSGISGEQLASSDGLLATSDSCLKSWARLVENDSFVPGREVWSDAQDQRLLFDDQVIPCADETGNGIIVSDVMEGNAQKVHSIGKASAKSPHVDCQTNAQQVIGSSTCSSPSNTIAEIPRGKSSVTSVRIAICDGHPKAIDCELCESPASGASTVSHPAREDLKEQMSEPAVAQGPISDENTRASDFGHVLESGSLTKESFTRHCNQGFLTTKVAWQHPDVGETQACCCCCCSRREDVIHETQLRLQCVVPQHKASRAANGHASNEAVSTFDRSMLAPRRSFEILQSPPDRTMQRAHPDTEARWMPKGHASPSVRIDQHAAPSPVLRLMGKDVLVVSKDEQSQRQGLSYNGHHPGIGSAFHSGNSNSCPYPSATRDCINYDAIITPFRGNHSRGTSPHTRENRLGCYVQFASTEDESTQPRLMLNCVPHETKQAIGMEEYAELEAEPEIGHPVGTSTISSSCSHSQHHPLPSRGFLSGTRSGFPNIPSAFGRDSSQGRDRRPGSPINSSYTTTLPFLQVTPPRHAPSYFSSKVSDV